VQEVGKDPEVGKERRWGSHTMTIQRKRYKLSIRKILKS